MYDFTERQSENAYACLWSYLSPTLSVWAWFSVWRWVFRSKPASGAGTRTWALFGDTVLTAVQASPSSFHRQDRSGRSSTALMSTEINEIRETVKSLITF